MGEVFSREDCLPSTHKVILKGGHSFLSARQALFRGLQYFSSMCQPPTPNLDVTDPCVGGDPEVCELSPGPRALTGGYLVFPDETRKLAEDW